MDIVYGRSLNTNDWCFIPILKAYSIRSFEPTNTRSWRYLRMISVYSPTQLSHVRACAHTKVQKVQLGQQLVLCSPPLLLRRQERLLRCDGARRNFWEKIFCLSFSRDLWLRVVCLVNVSVWTRVYNYQQQQQQQHVFFHTFEISLYHHQCFETKLSKPSVKTL